MYPRANQPHTVAGKAMGQVTNTEKRWMGRLVDVRIMGV
jgi:hypothetical protein